MAHYGTLKDTVITTPSEDIRGAHVYGVNDDKLGKIADVIFDHSTGDIRYAVVDTGGWLHSKKFLVPADGLRASVKHDGDFESNLSKQQIESFPPTTKLIWNRRAVGANTKGNIARSGSPAQ